jgi:outer membrane protein assembly factor BamB
MLKRVVAVCGIVAVGAAAVNAADWPQWRGPKREGVSEEKSLLKEWPKEGPKVVWKVDNVGVGYASLAVVGGHVYTQGTIDGLEQVIALNEKDGSLLWKTAPTQNKAYENGQGNGPRATPTFDNQKLYTESGNGDLACLLAADGKVIWVKNLEKDFGGGVPGWGYSESPLVVGGGLIVTPGGEKGAIMALNKSDGKLVWRATEVKQGAHYCSPQLAVINGRKQVVQSGASSVYGVDLADGRFLWEYKHANNGTANCSMPIVFNDHVFASSAYNTGGGLVAVMPDGPNGHKVQEKYFEHKMQSHHGGIVRVGDEIYGFGNGGLICMNLATGKINWVDRSVGKGSVIAADGMLYLLSENHELALAEVNPAKYVEHGKVKLEDHGKPSWAHPVIANGKLYIRDQQSLTCYDIATR